MDFSTWNNQAIFNKSGINSTFVKSSSQTFVQQDISRGMTVSLNSNFEIKD